MIDVPEKLFDPEQAHLNNEVFSDPEIYRLEMERIFGQCWLFVAHESMLPRDGSYVSNFMGEDSVIVWRGTGGRVRVFLNKCLHRGNKICLFERGESQNLTCTFHGWTYNSEGQLSGIPFLQESYHDRLDRERLGLVEARVATYAGFIFACWDRSAPSLDDYLGDMRWYMDNVMALDCVGGLEVLPGKQKYLMPANWKLQAENFGSDVYHVPVSHGSFLKLMKEEGQPRAKADGRELSANYNTGAAHAMGLLKIADGAEELFEIHLDYARPFGAEAVDWVKDRWARIREQAKPVRNPPYSFVNANVFPNFSTIINHPAFEARGLILWHPRSPLETEAWQWLAVERDCPRILKEAAMKIVMRRQSGAGMIAADDTENFERTRDNTATPFARTVPFNYQMNLGEDTTYAGHDDPTIEGLPGLIGPHMSEVNQRQFYRYWTHVMGGK